MYTHLRHALRAARLRCAPRTGIFADHEQPSGVPRWGTSRVQHSSGLVAPIGHVVRLQLYSAAPCHGKEEEDEVDRKVRQMMKGRPRVFRTAQRTLTDYLHVKRGWRLTDARHISERSPVFLSELLEQVKEEAEFRPKSKQRLSKALARLFDLSPVNEFKPFLESIGLTPKECDSLLPQNPKSIADELENYCVLCGYGVARGKIGRIYRDATEVFSFGHGVLASKLKALEDLGFSKASVIKLVISTPVVLVRDPDAELKTILRWLDDIAVQRDWIAQFFSARESYDWQTMVEVLQFLSDLGFALEDIGTAVRKNPNLLLEGSGKRLRSLIQRMQKLGAGKRELLDLFLNFPNNVSFEDFGSNTSKAICSLYDIGMSRDDVIRLWFSHGWILGRPIKAASTILAQLNVGKARLRRLIMEEPRRLLDYTVGSKVSRLPRCKPEPCVKQKAEFLKSIGFVEGSQDMKRVLKSIRGKGANLQDRYNLLVEKGLDPKDVAHMVKTAPQILNRKTDILAYKISFLVHMTGYPLSALPAFPQYLQFSLHKSKHKMLMYVWLLERGLAAPQLTLSRVLASRQNEFIKKHVKKVPMGEEVWLKFKWQGGSFSQEQIRWLKSRVEFVR